MLARLGLLARSVAATVLFPGIFAGAVPYLIVRPLDPPALADWSWRHYGAVLLVAMGLVLLLACIWQFAHSGRGTLAPYDEPRRLVVEGPYRTVRNPMYLGVLLVLLGEAWFTVSGALLAYTAAWLLAVNLFVLGYEEPNLRAKHGAEYERYCAAVRRWIPGRPDRETGASR